MVECVACRRIVDALEQREQSALGAYVPIDPVAVGILAVIPVTVAALLLGSYLSKAL